MVHVDNRDWTRYNEALVRRGEIFLSLDAVEEWEEELKGVNRGKEGARKQRQRRAENKNRKPKHPSCATKQSETFHGP